MESQITRGRKGGGESDALDRMMSEITMMSSDMVSKRKEIISN